MIIFNKIKYKNFLSSGNVPIEIELSKAHTTLIVGPNGSGKSTFLDALCFALFNRPFRGIKKEQMVNTINDSECEVTLDFSIGTKSYKIIRGIKPNLFEIYQDGTLINQEASNIDYQKYLETNIIRLNYRAFCQVALLGVSNYDQFMNLRPRHRREIVEEILDIRVFSLMDILLRRQQTNLSDKVVELRHKCDLIENKYELEKKHFDQIQDRDVDDTSKKKNVLSENLKVKQDYLEKFDNLNEKIAELNVKLQDKDKIQKKANQLSKLETKIEQNLETHQKSLKFFEENDNCPTCTQPIDEQFKDKKKTFEKEKIITLQDGMKSLLLEIEKNEKQILEMNSISKKIYEMNVEVSKLETSLIGLDNYSNTIHKELELLENKQIDSNSVKEELEQLKKDLEETKVERDKVIEEKAYIDVLRDILNDKGAKAQIIKKYVPIMNTLINQYLQAMDFFVHFHLDEEFNETVKSRFRDIFDYNSFSEGEKMRIDLALLFTWRQIAKMKNSVNTNLLILDEIFDSSLDGQGTDDFFKIIKTLEKENIFIISHKGDIMFDKFTNIIKYEKYKNFTRLQQT
jgi:DNA repair exonuclease SbcCD ATPase subunit